MDENQQFVSISECVQLLLIPAQLNMDSSDVDLFLTRVRQLCKQPLFFALKWINSCQLPSPFLNLCFYCCTVSLFIHLVIKSSSFSSSICGLLMFQTVQRPVVRQEENNWVKDFPLISSSDDRNILKACGVGVENEWIYFRWIIPLVSYGNHPLIVVLSNWCSHTFWLLIIIF